jgi:hypothetical protein
MKRYNPQITTVTGLPRHPQEQGSVENLNRRVRQALFSFERNQKLLGEEPNWTYGLGYAMASLNSKEQKGSHGVSSYMTVFGQPYSEALSFGVDTLRQFETVPQRLKFDPESTFSKMVRLHKWDEEFAASGSKDEDEEKRNTTTGRKTTLRTSYPVHGMPMSTVQRKQTTFCRKSRVTTDITYVEIRMTLSQSRI